MGIVLEPEGVEFLVEPVPPAERQNREFSAIVAKGKGTAKRNASTRKAMAILRRKTSSKSAIGKSSVVVETRRGLIRDADIDMATRTKPLTKEEAAAVSELLQKDREASSAVTRQRLEAEILQLPLSERAYLIHRLIDSLTPSTSVERSPNAVSKTRANSQGTPKSKRPRTAKARVSS